MLTDNGRALENSVLVSLPADRAPDETALKDLATRLRAAFPVEEAEYQEIIRRLHAKLAIQMDTGTVLTSETYVPWLHAKKASIEPFYWQRFQTFLQRREWPPRVISTLDRVTDDVLDLLHDPNAEGLWKRRGLVIGDVQSGKTATYTALCCKAADAGYRLIILFTGTLESLRRQTQERLDEGFVGLDSSGLLTQIKKSRAVGVGLVDSRKAAGVFTSREKDFSRNLLNALGFRLDAFNIPVLVVVKKNKRILENLERWLSDFNANQQGTIDTPLLLIDDEADSASVNTNPSGVDPTQINQRIRALLRLFSRFTAVQDQVASLVHELLAKTQQDIRNYSQLPREQALRNSSLARAERVWSDEYSDAGFTWATVQRSLLNSALPITVKAINQRTGAASLDYAVHKESGLRVIAVGGNSLSRGLTLEGLSTSYFFRNSQMYDTLLQMGRWFGYRDGYADLCRLWITDEAAQWYAHITSATEELRDEVKRMRQQRATPLDFGLKVRAHPDSLIVTAQNKMRQAKTIERVISLSGKSPETARLKSNTNSLIANRGALTRFMDQLKVAGLKSEKSNTGSNIVWRGVRKELVASLLRDFDVHPLNVTFQTGDLAKYLASATEPKLQNWDVAIPTSGTGKSVRIGGVTVSASKRSMVDDQNGMLVVSGTKARVGSRGVEKEGLDITEIARVEQEFRSKNPGKSYPDRIYRDARPRPLLLIHILSPNEPVAGGYSEEIIALGLSFPQFDDSDVAKRVTYRVNLVEWRSMLEQEIDDDSPQEDADVG